MLSSEALESMAPAWHSPKLFRGYGTLAARRFWHRQIQDRVIIVSVKRAGRHRMVLQVGLEFADTAVSAGGNVVKHVAANQEHIAGYLAGARVLGEVLHGLGKQGSVIVPRAPRLARW